jgi:precorrin-6B C5,15-methyltransferase / cobalt-precorrin-6B C5,C15-methyltransferase
VGGSGGRVGEILNVVCGRLRPRGRLVVSLATLENLSTTMAVLASHGFVANTTEINVARSQPVAGLTRLQAANPVFLVAGERAADGD